jgi:hypothetical protein
MYHCYMNSSVLSNHDDIACLSGNGQWWQARCIAGKQQVKGEVRIVLRRVWGGELLLIENPLPWITIKNLLFILENIGKQ